MIINDDLVMMSVEMEFYSQSTIMSSDIKSMFFFFSTESTKAEYSSRGELSPRQIVPGSPYQSQTRRPHPQLEWSPHPLHPQLRTPL